MKYYQTHFSGSHDHQYNADSLRQRRAGSRESLDSEDDDDEAFIKERHYRSLRVRKSSAPEIEIKKSALRKYFVGEVVFRVE